MTKFRIIYDPEWEQYEVLVYVDKVLQKHRTYFTDDLEDAKLTLKAMVAEETRIQRRIDRSG